PSVSTIEKPHGDHAPVTPAANAVPSRMRAVAFKVASSARHACLEVHDAEDSAPGVAVAGERFVAVDARPVVGAAVHQPADLAAAAAVPRAVDLRVEAISVWDPVLTDATARRRRQRTAVRIQEAAAVRVERVAVAVD